MCYDGGSGGDGMADSVNVRYKDTVFRLLFSDKARLLSLYNASANANATSLLAQTRAGVCS